MKQKKNPEKDLGLKRGFYFAIGLLGVLLAVYIALEWKFTEDNDGYDLDPYTEERTIKKDSSVVLETKAIK